MKFFKCKKDKYKTINCCKSKKIVEYHVISDEYLQGMMHKINHYLKKDWQPLGGLCHIERDGGNYHFAQVIVKYKD